MKRYQRLIALIALFGDSYFDYMDFGFYNISGDSLTKSKLKRNAERAKLISVKETLKKYENAKYKDNVNIKVRNYTHHGYSKRR